MCKIIPQLSFFYNEEIENLGDLERLNLVIENIDDSKLVKKLRKIRGNGRNDFPVGAMLNSIYAMMIYGHNSISSLIRELSRNSQLRKICGFIPFWRKDKYGVSKLITNPNNRAYTNFLKNLKECENEYEEIFNTLVKYMEENLENFGERLAGDGKLINSYAKHINENKKEDGRRDVDADYTVKEYTISNKKGEMVSKKKIYFGYRIHAIVDVNTELPVAINVTKASISEKPEMIKIIKSLETTHPNIIQKTKYFLADKGYDFTEINNELRKNGIIPIIDIKNNWQSGEETKQYKKTNIEYTFDGKVYEIDDENQKHKMVYLGYDKNTDSLRYGYDPRYKRSKKVIRIPINTDKRVFIEVARDSKKWKRIYKGRTSVERYNGRIDRDLGFEVHTIRGLKKMKMFVYLANIIMLGVAKGKISQNKCKHLAALKNIA